MSKANDLVTEVVAQLVADIEAGAAGLWEMPWQRLGGDRLTPTNAVTAKAYIRREPLGTGPHRLGPRPRRWHLGHLPPMAQHQRPGHHGLPGPGRGAAPGRARPHRIHPPVTPGPPPKWDRYEIEAWAEEHGLWPG